MIDTWITTQPMAVARPCSPAGTDYAPASGIVVSGHIEDARLRGTGLPTFTTASAVRNGSTVAAADKGTTPSSCAWSPPV